MYFITLSAAIKTIKNQISVFHSLVRGCEILAMNIIENHFNSSVCVRK